MMMMTLPATKDTNRTQTGHILDTFWTHFGHKKKPARSQPSCNTLILLVRSTGFEPVTFASEGRYRSQDWSV